MKKLLLIPDTHAPYHDKKAWALMLKAARGYKPDTIITLGDFQDFYAVSSHDKDPRRVRLLDTEIEAGNECRAQLDDLGAGKKIYVSGNHEDRLERYLMQKAPELMNLVRIRDLLELQQNGWQYVPYKTHVQVGRLYITHEVGNCGAYAHYKAMDTFQSNIVIGHTHRLGYAVVGSAKGKAHVGAMFGWLGDFSKVDYMHKVKALRDWAHGFGIGYQMDDGSVHLSPVPIINGSCVVEGRMYSL